MWGTRGSEHKFIEKNTRRLEGEDGYTKSATVPARGRTPMVVITMTYKQALRVAARESKAVRRSLIDKLEELQQANSPTPSIPPNITRSSTPGCRVSRTENAAGTNSWWPLPLKSILPTGYQWLMES
ncbi:putative antirepressor [Escherichia coli]|uniref:Putative antirepressor n=1 Tax=Escherichia coli TaxID=562 RepID=A0A377AYL4_ECOLX|nr:putative antirepressor [Escherichia coli]